MQKCGYSTIISAAKQGSNAASNMQGMTGQAAFGLVL